MEELGRGTMGAVYKATDPMMDREVAIKTILSNALSGPQAAEFRERFFREAKAAGRLAHPGIVTVFDVSEHEGIPFLVMEYVVGQTLQSLLQSGVRFNADTVLDLGIQLADALEYAHSHGVIHRDIKPANILVTEDYRTKITDFGVAKLAESQVTSAGQLLGTPAYMAPEQFTGAPIDRRADLFALGVVIYFLATGDKPFNGDTALAVQYRVVHTDPVSPRKLNPAISQGVEAVILRSIEKDPALRYQSAAELAGDLRTVRAGGHVPSHNPATAADEPPVIKSRDDTTVVLPSFGSRARAAKVVLLVALALVLAWTGSRAARLLMDVPEPLQVAVAVPALPVLPAVPSVPDPEPTPPSAPEEKLEEKKTVAAEVTRPVKVAAPKTVTRRPVDPPPASNAVSNAPVIAPPPPPPPPAEETRPVSEPLPEPPVEDDVLPGRTVAPVGAPARQRELSQSANSVRLLVTSPTVPTPFTVIVTMDNEVLLRHDVQGPVSEEVSLPPGQHRLRVNLLMAARRIGRPQEVTGRFFPGQRRVLNIEFLPDAPRGSDSRERNRFTVTLK